MTEEIVTIVLVYTTGQCVNISCPPETAKAYHDAFRSYLAGNLGEVMDGSNGIVTFRGVSAVLVPSAS